MELVRLFRAAVAPHRGLLATGEQSPSLLSGLPWQPDASTLLHEVLSSLRDLEMRVPLHLPQMSIWIGKVAVSAAPERVACTHEDRRAPGLGLGEHAFEIVALANAVGQGHS